MPTTRTLARIRIGLSAVAAAGVLAAAPVGAQVLMVGTDQVGGVVNAMGGAVAKVVAEAGLNTRLRAFSGPEAWLPDLDTGRLHFGVHMATSPWMAYNSVDTNLQLKGLRILRAAAGLDSLGFMVRKDSDIKTVEDLRGRRVTAGFGGMPTIRRMSTGVMRDYGIDPEKDIRPVPVVNVVEGTQALIEGRADAHWGAVGAPITREADSRVGLRFLSFGEIDEERLARLRRNIFPGYQVSITDGRLPWAPEGTVLLRQEFYVLTSAAVDDDTVRRIADALWNAEDALKAAHPAMRGYGNENAVSSNPVIPYHPAAIAFYRNKGVWTDAAEAANRAVAGN